MKPRLLDLFCGGGGASMGYYRAGFEVVGVDIKPQPRYPFEFHQGDALTYPLEGFDAYHASPPCQPFAKIRKLTQSQGKAKDYPELIEPIRKRLLAIGKPYVIENVPGAPLIEPLTLCGSFFGLPIRRHRLFEMNFEAWGVPCAHYAEIADKPPLHRLTGKSRVVGCYGNGRGKGDNKVLWSKAMGITWMTRKEMSQAIPPAYTEYIGKYLMRTLVDIKLVRLKE
jgi:DNA (cytosine-5)-methyltransferase 1